MRCHFRAPISAHCKHREPFSGGAAGKRKDMLGHIIMYHADQLIGQECIAMRDFVPG